jgi:hypothetical protein
MPTQDQKVALQQLKAFTGSNEFAHSWEVDEAPGILKGLLLMANADRAKNALLEMSKAVDNASSFDAKSVIPRVEKKDSITEWASGNGTQIREFKKPEVADYFDDLFKWVSAMTLSLVNDAEYQRLTRNDLFHGHLVHDLSGALPDILMVFHGKEFPKDTQETPSDNAKKLEAKNRHGDKVPFREFRSTEQGYLRRNTVYSVRLRRFWNLNYKREHLGRNPYRVFLDQPFDYAEFGLLDPLVLEQNNLGTNIGDVNCFISEGATSFLKMNP